jgi:enoyl-CoA hydratase/carnithine racemase
MPFEHIRLEQDAGIVTLTLNRPESRNAMSPEMGDEIVRATAMIRDNREARVLVVTGAGKAFSSGGNLSMLARDAGVPLPEGSDAPTMAGSPRDFYARYLSIRQVGIPTIAAINGHAIGAGMCFALACDLRICAAEAKMGMTFTKLGIHPGMGATFLLPRLIGTSRACELFFTGRVIDAVEADRLGIVTRVVPGGELNASVTALAREIASAGPVAVRMVKRAIYRGVEHTLDEMLDFEALQQSVTFTTEDAREGVTAIMEKREPRFVGR